MASHIGCRRLRRLLFHVHRPTSTAITRVAVPSTLSPLSITISTTIEPAAMSTNALRTTTTSAAAACAAAVKNDSGDSSSSLTMMMMMMTTMLLWVSSASSGIADIAQCEEQEEEEPPPPQRRRPNRSDFTSEIKSSSSNKNDNGSHIINNSTSNKTTLEEEEELWFQGLFPYRQLWQPKVPYPGWDRNWDDREPPPALATSGEDKDNKSIDKEQVRRIRKHGVTRHILLIRHGQYHEASKDDAQRTLTDLGRLQAAYTGKRLQELILSSTTKDMNPNDSSATFACRVTALRVSDMTRAKETADIIASYLQLPTTTTTATATGAATAINIDETPQVHLQRLQAQNIQPPSLLHNNHNNNHNTALALASSSSQQPPSPPPIVYHESDPDLNEGRPCHHIPGVKASPKVIQVTGENHLRIEKAFHKYFYRAPYPPPPPPTTTFPVVAAKDNASGNTSGTSESTTPIMVPAQTAYQQHPSSEQDHHEFEIIVCHANVIRYFVCRALQLPPEAWLRFCPFNCSVTYLTIRPTGTVSCRLLGDIGHLPYNLTTFSQHHGFNW